MKDEIILILSMLGLFFLVGLIFVPLVWAVFTIGNYFGFPFWITIAFLVIMLYIIIFKMV